MNAMLASLAVEAHQAAMRDQAARQRRARGRARRRPRRSSLLNLALLRTVRGG